MRSQSTLAHEFVDYIPDDIEEGTVYMSVQFATAVHKCCCGCGREVVTPLSPTDWKLIFDGQTISLDPSIGNWSYPCQSHYWIRRNQVVWAPHWSRAEIEAGRAHDKVAKVAFFESSANAPEGIKSTDSKASQRGESENFWARFKKWLS